MVRSQLRLRVLLPIAVLALLGLGVGAFAYGKPPASDSPPLLSASALRQHRKQALQHTKKHEKKSKTHAEKTANPKQPAKTANPKPPAKPENPKPAKPKQSPNPLSEALAAHEVVVVMVYTPGSTVDELATAEARAGADAAGAGFLTVDVADEQAVSALAIDFQIRSAPAVLVFKRGPKIATEIDGYADRSTVEQAAENAAA